MRKLIYIYSTIFIILLTLFTASGQDKNKIKLSEDINSKNANTKITALCNYSEYLYSHSVNNTEADSFAFLAIIESKLKDENLLLANASICYSKVSLSINKARVIDNLNTSLLYAEKTNNKDLLFKLNMAFAEYYYNDLDFRKSKEYLEEAFKNIDNSKEKEILYLIAYAKYEFQINEKLKAFESINQSIFISKAIEDDSLLFRSKLILTNFYHIIEDYDKMKNELDGLNELIEDKNNISIKTILEYKSELISYYLNKEDFDVALKIFDEAIIQSQKEDLIRMKNDLFVSMRSGLLANDKRKEIDYLYKKKYPEELIELRRNHPSTYYRVQALIQENAGNIDSAKQYINLAENLTLESQNKSYIAVFYKRKGQFFLRQNELNPAIDAFKNYYNFSMQTSFYPYIIDASGILDSIYALKGNFEEAYKYASLKILYSDSNAVEVQKDKLMKIELNQINKINQLEKEKEELVLNKKINFQIIIIITAFIALIIFTILISKYKVPENLLKFFSYISFILFFELIIYFADNFIHHTLANGQPLIILAIKIVFIGIIMPIHHGIEHRFFKYLSRKRKIKINQKTFFETLKANFASLKKWMSTSEDNKKEEIN
ncbi:MAG TPA: hypothetical protein VLZ83_14920 [Edaphocola sp.]|nr:hypothetical protein [Edaphocola sp.]